MEALLASVAVPAWAIVVGTLSLLLLLILWLRPRAEGGDSFGSFGQLALVLIVGALGFFGLRYLEDDARNNERHAFAQRASALLAQTSQSGVISCIDGSMNETLNEACEKLLFSEPPRTTAALALTRQRLSFIADVVAYSADRELPLQDQIENLRAATEADPFGFVAQTMAEKDNCTPESCMRFRLLRNSSHVQENLKEKKFETLLAKHFTKTTEATKPMGQINSLTESNSVSNSSEAPIDHPMIQTLGVRVPGSDSDSQITATVQPSTAPIPQARPKPKNITATVTPAGATRSLPPNQSAPAAQFAPTLPPPGAAR